MPRAYGTVDAVLLIAYCWGKVLRSRVSRFRHVMLPKDMLKLVPKGKLMSENEWRGIGVQQSQGWVHYMVHTPEPHILLFRRPITDQDAAKRAHLLCK